jgi:hypothetical protein
MIQIDFFPLYGVLFGFNYTNENIEEVELLGDDLRHTMQFFLFLFGFNVHWFTQIKTDE